MTAPLDGISVLDLTRNLAGKWHGVRGCDKVLFASDFPLMDLDRVTRDARQMALSEDRLQKFLFGNARALLWPDG